MTNSEIIKISVIIPTCDRPDFLPKTVDSVIAQTRKPNEIIVVNNGAEKVSLPEQVTEKIKVFNIMVHAGVAQARNFGACVAKNDYLAFLDDDDLWNPEYLEKVERSLQKDTKCVISRLDKLDCDKIRPYKNADGFVSIENLLTYNPGITGSNTVISTEKFFEVGGFDPKLPPSEDKSLILELLRIGITPVVLGDNQVIHRVHDNPRLSADKKMAEGINQFTRKYKHLMSLPVFFFNKYKFHRHSFLGGKRTSFLGFVFFSFLYKATKIILKK